MFKGVLLALLCLALFSTTHCRKSTSSSRRGSSRGGNNKNYGNGATTGTGAAAAAGGGTAAASQSSSSGGWFGGWFSSGSTKTAGASVTPKKDTTGSSYGWSNPSNAKPAQTNGFGNTGQTQGSTYWSNNNNNGPKTGQNYGWTNPGQNNAPKVNNQFQPKPNAPPSSNIGPGGYPVQSGMNHGGYNSGYHRGTGGFNYPQQPSFNPGYTGHHGGGFGGYSSPHYSANSYSSNHGFTPSFYPSHSSAGYPGQGLFGSSKVKYGGMGLFGGGTGSFGYPGSGSWGGYPSYGSSRSGTGSLLKGMAVGAIGGYLASSLIRRISNPWGYSGYGYGSGYGYDRGYHQWQRDEYERYRTSSTTTEAPRPEDQWIHCVAFDPSTNTTLINPSCSCTVTTSVDPVTNLPIATHYCTTQNGQVVPQPQLPHQLPPQHPPQQLGGVNDPNASPSYLNNYGIGQGYGGFGGGGYQTPTDSTPVETTTAANETDTPIPELQSQGTGELIHEGKAEFFSRLEKLVNMGRFAH